MTWPGPRGLASPGQAGARCAESRRGGWGAGLRQAVAKWWVGIGGSEVGGSSCQGCRGEDWPEREKAGSIPCRALGNLSEAGKRLWCACVRSPEATAGENKRATS